MPNCQAGYAARLHFSHSSKKAAKETWQKYENSVYEEKLKHLPNVGAIVKTVDGEGEVDNVEILKERVRVKLKTEDGYIYKKFDAKDLEIIKDATKEQLDEEEIEHKKELEELEKLEQEDEKNTEKF